jgi:hypothetical protein
VAALRQEPAGDLPAEAAEQEWAEVWLGAPRAAEPAVLPAVERAALPEAERAAPQGAEQVARREAEQVARRDPAPEAAVELRPSAARAPRLKSGGSA